MFPRYSPKNHIFIDTTPHTKAIQYSEIIGFAAYVSVLYTVRSTRYKYPNTGDYHRALLRSYRFLIKSKLVDDLARDALNNNPNLFKFNELVDGTAKEKESGKDSFSYFLYLQLLLIPARLLIFALKLVTEIPVRILELLTEKLTVDAINFVNDTKNNLLLRSIALTLAMINMVVLVIPLKILSITIRSILSHEEIWSGAGMWDNRLFPKLTLWNVGPIELAARLYSTAVFTIACLYCMPLLFKLAPMIYASSSSKASIITNTVVPAISRLSHSSAIISLSLYMGLKNIIYFSLYTAVKNAYHRFSNRKNDNVDNDKDNDEDEKDSFSGYAGIFSKTMDPTKPDINSEPLARRHSV